jgi:hypothetical protein
MSSISNDQNGNGFLTRVSEIPLVKSFCQTLTNTYETTKNSNRFIGAALDKTEGYAKFANEQAEPLIKYFDRPLSTVSRIADQQLEQLQQRYPVINTTPSDLKEYGHNLYDRTGVRRRVNDVTEAKNRSVEKITGTTTTYRNRLIESTRNGQTKINNYLSGALDFFENFIDKYVAAPENTSDISYTNRFLCISNKAIHGAKYRVVISFDTAKGYASRGVHKTGDLLKNTTSAVGASIEKVIADTTKIRDAILRELVNRSYAITAKGESAAVFLTKSLSNGVVNISDRVISSASPFLPEGVEKSAASLVTYAHHWQERVQKASSAKDIWHVASDETNNNFQLAKQYLTAIMKHNDLNVEHEKRW